MTKDVAKLRRAALSSDAVSVNCLSTATSTADEHSCRPDQLVVIRTAREAAAAGQRSAKTGFPARLSHYFLPLRLTDKPALLDWIVEQDLSMVRGPKG